MCASEEEHAHEAKVYFGQDRKRCQSGEDGEGNTPSDPDHHAHVGAVYLPTGLVKNCENSAALCVYYIQSQRHHRENFSELVPRTPTLAAGTWRRWCRPAKTRRR